MPAQLAQAIVAGRVARDTLIWTAGMSGWSVASEIEALVGNFASQPPPIPAV